MDLRLLVSLISTTLLLSLMVSGDSQMKSWCRQTPYPEPCEYNLTHNSKYTRNIKQKPDFFKLSVELALDQALHAQNNTHTLGPKCRNEREKAAWIDCVELYEHTVQMLNKTADPYSKCNPSDTQTWLSTALTNLETCQTGFEELGVADYVLPLMYNNVSKLISNSLAMNDVPYGETSYKDGFPTWIKPGDRKLLQASSLAAKANVVVAQDGSGNFKTVAEGVAAAPSGSSRFVIYVKAGMYEENVQITAKDVTLVGDGIGKTIITGNKSVGGGSSTYNSATVAVTGDNFIAQGITFRNTAGAANGQAVALRSSANHSVFYQCSFEGYQDTLYVHSQIQFFRNCDIYGTVDFIFGNAAVVFQNCNIFARNPPHKTNTITAQGDRGGISFHNCIVTAAPDLKPYLSSVKTYLGRPWGDHARTVFMKTYLDSLIDPAGWIPWSGKTAPDTLYYGEYNNTGPGSSTTGRVKWTGYHAITSASVASQFTVGNFIAGDSWLPATGVPYTSGL